MPGRGPRRGTRPMPAMMAGGELGVARLTLLAWAATGLPPGALQQQEEETEEAGEAAKPSFHASILNPEQSALGERFIKDSLDWAPIALGW